MSARSPVIPDARPLRIREKQSNRHAKNVPVSQEYRDVTPDPMFVAVLAPE
jgi:hypothetical protein